VFAEETFADLGKNFLPQTLSSLKVDVFERGENLLQNGTFFI